MTQVLILPLGEIFGGLAVAPDSCDGLALLRELGRADDDVLATLDRLEGPWALCFWQARAQRLWVARDALGERYQDLIIDIFSSAHPFLHTYNALTSKDLLSGC